MFFRGKRLLWVSLLLLVTSVINAAPTISTCDSVTCNLAVSSYLYAQKPEDTDFPNLIAHSDSTIAAAAAGLLKAPADFTTYATPPYNYSKNLPAVPSAAFMLLSGFLCVSLVKDRRMWLAAFAGLLWAGQVSIELVPQLALCFSHSNSSQQRICAEISHSLTHENSPRLGGDKEVTRYIGLLRHLEGIPVNSSTFTYPSATIESQFASYPLLRCPVQDCEKFVNFSAAFIFNNLSRGPPTLT